jgi:hypothetical protein
MQERFGIGLVLVLAAVVLVAVAAAQDRQAPGKSIGSVSTQGNLVVLTLDEGALGQPNLFDLARHTLRFTPDAAGYRVENTAFSWDSAFGDQLPAGRTDVKLRDFGFSFSGKTWDTVTVDATGSIGFGAGVTIGRFDQLQKAAALLVNKTPAICVFMKPRLSGPRYVKQLSDRVVITWTLTEPAGGIQDFTWTPTVNRFQAALAKDGTILMSYDEVAARDAIVGVYPTVAAADAARVAAVDLSSAKPADGPFAAVYESFHYLALPNPRDLTCTVLNALGDRFDFLAYYSDFRVDNQEAGTPSNGPLGGGPTGGAVSGIGAPQRNLASYCTGGRFQWQFVQPVYVGANQMQERPPAGLTDANGRNIGFYAHQLGRRTPDGTVPAYDYAMSQIGHEMGHRWSAFVSARVTVNGASETIPLGPTHWARGLHAPVPFPFQRPTEASAMGGGVWQDNFDGTFTQLDDDYYVPATGYSYLDLYLMGLLAPSEVPDFFILRNLTPAWRDIDGHPIFKAERTKISVQDVIAAEGARQPDVDHAQTQFNTGIVVVVEHGRKPSRELVERAAGIRAAWIEYFAASTGHRASMTAMVK